MKLKPLTKFKIKFFLMSFLLYFFLYFTLFYFSIFFAYEDTSLANELCLNRKFLIIITALSVFMAFFITVV